MNDIKLWDKVKLSDGTQAQVTSFDGECLVCKWHVDNVLHMATLSRSEVTPIEDVD